MAQMQSLGDKKGKAYLQFDNIHFDTKYVDK